MKRPGLSTERATAKMLRSPTFLSVFGNPLSGMKKMNDHVSLLLQGYAAKRKLAELFESEGLGLADQPPIATAAHESIPAVQPDIKQSSKLFRENCRRHGLVRNRPSTALRTSQRGQMKRDLTVSGFVFALVSVGVILAAYTDRPVFWLLNINRRSPGCAGEAPEV
jgi:hypothetical protein